MERQRHLPEALRARAAYHTQVADHISTNILPTVDRSLANGQMPTREVLAPLINDCIYGPDGTQRPPKVQTSRRFNDLSMFSRHDLGSVSLMHEVHKLPSTPDPDTMRALLDTFQDAGYIHQALSVLFDAPLQTTSFSLSDIARRVFQQGSRRLAYDSGRPPGLHEPISVISREEEKNLRAEELEEYFAGITNVYDHTSSDIIVDGHPGAIFLTAYNIFKNGIFLHEHLLGRAFDSPQTKRFNELMDKMGKDHIETHIEAVDAGEHAVLYVWDNAIGFDITAFKQFISDLAKNNPSRINDFAEEGIISNDFYEAIQGWKDNPFDNIKLYPLLPETMLIGRFSNSLPWSAHSGIGLYGAQLLTKKLGAKIIVGEQIDGGAVFAVVIPKNTKSNSGITDERDIASSARPTLLRAA